MRTSTLGIVLLMLGCTVSELRLEGHRCPCVAGWECDRTVNLCVPMGALDAGASETDAGTQGRADSGDAGVEAGLHSDARATSLDSGSRAAGDSGLSLDSSRDQLDSGPALGDAEPIDDGSIVDGGSIDSKFDAMIFDSGGVDSGRADSGRVDSGGVDSGHADSGRVDSGRPDSGSADSSGADSSSADASPSAVDASLSSSSCLDVNANRPLCDGFESTTLAAAWELVTSDAQQGDRIALTRSIVYRGRGALRAEANTGSGWSKLARAVFPSMYRPSTDHWLRAYYYVPSGTPLGFEIHEFGSLDGDYNAVSQIGERFWDIHGHGWIDDARRETSRVFTYDRWICVETHIHFDSERGSYELYLDGQLAVSIFDVDSTAELGMPYITMGVAWRPDDLAGPRVVYIDEVVADSTRIGCD